MKRPYQSGDHLVAVKGNRRVDVENRNGVLWAVPVLKNDGMSPLPLQRWLDSLIHGARRIRKMNTKGQVSE